MCDLQILFEPIDQVSILKCNSDVCRHPSNEENFPNVFYEVDGENDKLGVLKIVDKTKSTNLKNECLGTLCVALSVIKDKVTSTEGAGTSKSKKYVVVSVNYCIFDIVTLFLGLRRILKASS